MADIFLALGSNLGMREKNLAAAIEHLNRSANVDAQSPVYESPPWGFTDQPAFLNQVVRAQTALSPLDLLQAIKEIETAIGRKPSFRYGPRLIDIDILFYDALAWESEELKIPHPHLQERAFVLIPMADIAPNWVHPGLQFSIITLLEMLPAEARLGLKRLPIPGP